MKVYYTKKYLARLSISLACYHDLCRDIMASANNSRLMAEHRRNDSKANRKNSCNRNYCNYRSDHTGTALIGQQISI